VRVYPTDSPIPKPPIVDELQDAFVFDGDRGWERGEIGEDSTAIPKTSASDFAYDERVHEYCAFFKQLGEHRISGPEVVDPDRRIDQNHLRAGRRRGIESAFVSLPPRAASRFPASRAISACKPAWTRAVFS
jgi:hypothetical protein